MREGRCISLIQRLKQGSELKSTPSIGIDSVDRQVVPEIRYDRLLANWHCCVVRLQRCALWLSWSVSKAKSCTSGQRVPNRRVSVFFVQTLFL